MTNLGKNCASRFAVLLFILLNSSTFLYGQGPVYEEAGLLIDKGKFQEALEILREIDLKDQELEPKALISIYTRKGYVNTVLGKTDSGRYFLDMALALAREDSVNRITYYASVQHQRAFLEIGSGNPMGGRKLLEEVVQIRAEHDTLNLPESKFLLALSYLKAGQFPNAIEKYEEILTVHQPLPKRMEARLLFEYGQAEIFMRRGPAALQKLEKSKELFTEHYQGNNHPDMIDTYSYLGYLYGQTGKLETGKKHVEKAIEVLQEFFPPDFRDFSVTYYYAGGIYHNLHEFDRAISVFQEAIRIEKVYTEGKMTNNLANFYMSLGAAYMGKEDFAKSLQATQIAVSYFNSQPNPHPFMDQLYSNIGQTHMRADNLDSAIYYLDLSYQLASQKYPPNHPSMINRYKVYGDVYRKMQNHKEAISYYDKAAVIEAEYSGGISSRLSQLRLHQAELSRVFAQDIEAARAYQVQALNALGLSDWLRGDDYRLTPQAWENPGNISELCPVISKGLVNYGNSPEEILANRKKALDIIEVGEAIIDTVRMRYLTASAKLTLAQKSRILFETGVELAYDVYTETQDRSYMDLALRLSEKSKALLLLLGLKHVQGLENANIPLKLLEFEQALADKLMKNNSLLSRISPENTAARDSIRQVLFSVNTQKDSLIQALEANYPRYHQVKYSPEIPDIAGIQQNLLGEEEAVLVYFLSPKFLFSIYIDQERIRFERDSIPANFGQKIADFRDLIYSPVSATEDTALEVIQQKFIAESRFFYEAMLSSVPKHDSLLRLKLIPDGGLGLINPDLLLSQEPEEFQDFRNYPFAIHDYSFSLSYSLGLWKYLHQTRSPVPTSPRLLAFQPSYPVDEESPAFFTERRSGFGPLKHSAEEVQGISSWYNSKILSGRNASEENFYKEAHNFPIIHISSHAQVSPGGNNAFVALTHTDHNQYDDSLTISELYGQRLQAEMVVLSACETGIGKLAQGEGIMSLGRAFTYAGARSLIMSLWEVNDAATADIMTDFYQYLATGQSKDLALRNAKLDYLNNSDQLRALPYYWAGFVARGDMGPLPYKESKLKWWLLGLLILGIGVYFIWRK